MGKRRGRYRRGGKRLVKEWAMRGEDDGKEITPLLAMDVTIQVALLSVFIPVKRCHIWPLPFALSALVSLAIFWAIKKRLEFNWRNGNKFLPVQRDNATDLEISLTQSQFGGRPCYIGFLLVFILLSAITACSFKIVLC